MKIKNLITTSSLFIIGLLISLYIGIPAKQQFNINLFGKTINLSPDYTNLPSPLSQIPIPEQIKTGLDIKGGSQLVFQADMYSVEQADRQEALQATKNTFDRRINLLGVNETTVQTAYTNNDYRLLVEIPGVTNVSEAVEIVGKTAQLDFRLPEVSSKSGQQFVSTGLKGDQLKRAHVDFDQNTSQPVVAIEFNKEGSKKFATITTDHVNQPLAIFLDDQLISAPTINTPITHGQAIITGDFSLEEAQDLTIQLNSGALPVPVKLLSQSTVGATLGQASINKSFIAGLVGGTIVILFMIVNYGWLGLLASLSLLLYTSITLAIFKLGSFTLTLPGIAGFLLSLGMAVDANILIFERFKEETRLGRSKNLGMELAFSKAWISIRDANLCTLITCFVLFNPLNWQFLNTSGPVRGFALTLAIGILVSLFTGIVVTRNLVRTYYLTNNTHI